MQGIKVSFKAMYLDHSMKRSNDADIKDTGRLSINLFLIVLTQNREGLAR
jgi:hypothetical protein